MENEMKNRGWKVGATERLLVKIDNKKRNRRLKSEIHLEFKVEVAASALPDPVCLHGFNSIPLWKVCQSIQERLRRDPGTKTHETDKFYT